MRVLLLALPRLLRGMFVHAVQQHGDCELLQDTSSPLEMLTRCTSPPDIVILGLSADEDATLVPAIFARWPHAQVMTVMPAGEDAVLYELRPRQQRLGELSPAEIVAALHDAVRQRGTADDV
ncbi:MAG TPA: hypothetical protein VIL35_10305 [Vicinamibacterales bacterium]